jgi:cardiolipin synthase A/B
MKWRFWSSKFSVKRKGSSAKKTRRNLIFTSVGATLVAGLLVLNFTTGEKVITRAPEHLYAINNPQLTQTMGNMPGPAITSGNRIEALQNGDEIFPAMLDAIRGAKNNITFETYIYWSGAVGREFASALAERARSGIKVHVIIDSIGGKEIDDEATELMENAGVQLKRYRPLRWYHTQRLNKRTHRKLLIVDGLIGFTGGVGIGDPWRGNAQDSKHWRDSHFRVEGPAVSQMQSVFMENWIEVAGEVLHGPDYFPAPRPAGESDAQVVRSSPSSGSANMTLLYLLAINAAEKSLDIASAYFIPDELTRKALVAAARRGVKVQVLTGGANTDNETSRRASRARWGELLEAGVEIYEYQPTMFHCKLIVADELFASVGSANFDPRSFGLNDEANINVYDPRFARRQIETFQEDLMSADRMTLKKWEDRPLPMKLWEALITRAGPAL